MCLLVVILDERQYFPYRHKPKFLIHWVSGFLSWVQSYCLQVSVLEYIQICMVDIMIMQGTSGGQHLKTQPGVWRRWFSR